MISDILGLSINQKVLNKKSPSSVVSTLEKTATNYIAIGRMVEDLKLIRLNFSRWLAMEGVKVKGTPDMHMLKEDELTKKFGVLREEYSRSKITRVAQDGTSDKKGWAKNLFEMYVGYKITRKVERKVTASILKRYRKLTAIRKLVRLKKKILSVVNKLIEKINIKKMFKEWAKKNLTSLVKPLVDVFSKSLQRFFKTGLKKLLVRFSTATIASLWSGPFAPIVASLIVIGLMIWDPIQDAINEFKKGGNFFETFFVSLVDEFTFGLFGKENIKDFKDSFTKWFDNLFKNMFNAVDKSFKFIEEKMNQFSNFIMKKVKSMFVTKENMSDFVSAFDTANKERLEQEQRDREKYAQYFEQMNQSIENKKTTIRQLEFEIATLEYELKSLVEGPEKARLEAAKIEKVKQEQELAVLEEERIKTREGGGPAVIEPKLKEEKVKIPTTVTPKPEIKKEKINPPQPERVIETPKAKTPTQTTGEYEKIKQLIIANEGWKNKVYKDSRGLWTVGVGHLIGNGKKMPFEEEGIKFTEKTELTNQQVRELFEKDFSEHLELAKKAPGWDKANEAGKAGLIDLTYNMGGYWYKKFKTAAGLLAEGKFKEAANEFKNSKWYKQVGDRAPATVSLISAGSASDKEGATALAAVMTTTKVASAGKFIGQESTQIAQAQREQLKPKSADVINVAQTNNNKRTQQQNIAMSKPGPDASSTMSNRVAA